MITFLVALLRASWMMAEQLVLWEHEQTETDLSLRQAWKKQGKLRCEVYFFMFCSAMISPFVFLWITFRVLSFALITSILRYWAIPLYIALVLGSISAGVFFNRKDRNFAIRGLKSVLSIGSFPEFFLIYPFCPFQLITDTTSSMKLSSKYIGQS